MPQTRERQLVYGTPVQLLRAQTEAVAYKPTLARPSARNSRYGIGGGRCGGCVSHRRELSTSLTINIEPTRCSGLAEHALHPGAVTARLESKQRPRAARAEAARVGRWWPLLDSNGVTLFVQQYDRGTCCKLLLAINTWYRTRHRYQVLSLIHI